MAIIPILLLEFAVFVIIYGIRFTIRIDANNMSICLKCYILDYIEVICFKLFVCDGKFYYQINKGKLRAIEKRNEDTQEKGNNKKLRVWSYITQLWSKRPNLKIEKLSVSYAGYFQDEKNRVLFDSALSVVSNALAATGSGKLKVRQYQLKDVSGESNFSGVEAECVIGVGLFKLLFFAIYAFAVKRKYQVKE